MSLQKKIAHAMLKVGAVELNPTEFIYLGIWYSITNLL